MRTLLSVSCLFLSALVAEAAVWRITLVQEDGSPCPEGSVKITWASGYAMKVKLKGETRIEFLIPDADKSVVLECTGPGGTRILRGLNGALDQTLEIVVPGKKLP